MTKQTHAPNLPTAVVPLDRPRTLAFTLGAMHRIQEITGKPIAQLQELSESELLTSIHEYVWAMLVNEDREGLTPADIAEMLWPGNLQEVVEGFSGLLERSTPGAGPGVPGTGNPTKRGRKSR